MTEALDAARKAYDAAKDEANAFEQHAREQRRNLQTKISDAKTAYDALLSAETPAHEWEGRKVTKVRHRYSTYGGVTDRAETLFGAVHTFRVDTILPASIPAWRRPNIGEPFVRLLTKSGKEGQRIDTILRGWELCND